MFYFLRLFIKFRAGLQGSFSFLYFFFAPLIFFGHVAAIASPWPIKRDKYPRYLSTPMKTAYQSTSKYIWGKCLKSLFGQQKNAVHQVLVKHGLKESGFKQARFIAFLKLLGEKPQL